MCLEVSVSLIAFSSCFRLRSRQPHTIIFAFLSEVMKRFSCKLNTSLSDVISLFKAIDVSSGENCTGDFQTTFSLSILHVSALNSVTKCFQFHQSSPSRQKPSTNGNTSSDDFLLSTNWCLNDIWLNFPVNWGFESNFLIGWNVEASGPREGCLIAFNLYWFAVRNGLSYNWTRINLKTGFLWPQIFISGFCYQSLNRWLAVSCEFESVQDPVVLNFLRLRKALDHSAIFKMFLCRSQRRTFKQAKLIMFFMKRRSSRFM